MTADSRSTASNFFAMAQALDFVADADAVDLVERCRETGQPPSQVALQAGMLNAVDIDIVETLLRPTEVIPGYEIKRLLGQGGMGVVYRAVQLNLNRMVAIKTILISRMSDRSIIGRFEQEAKTIGQLVHPNIVTAHDFGRHEGRLFLVMEFVNGRDGESLLQERGRFDERTVLSIVRQTAAGLGHAAAHDVVHRDIKPANLMLLDPPKGTLMMQGVPMVKVMDFGLAFLSGETRVETRLTSQDQTVGSPHYMAPEQLGGGAVDFRADIYALGATAYHMLSGRPPFANATLSQIIAAKLTGSPMSIDKIAPHVSPQTRQLVQRMMNRNPQERFTSYDELIRKIDGNSPTSTTEVELADTDVFDRTTVLDDVAKTQTMPITGATTPDIQSSEPAPSTSRRRLLGLLGFVAITVVGLLILMFAQPANPLVALRPVSMSTTGWTAHLFLGTSTKGWTNRFGNWVAAKDDEGASVLSGTDGVISRPLFLKRDNLGRPSAPEFYRMAFSLRSHEATAIGLHFALQPVDGLDGERDVVRLTADGILIGTQAADNTPLQTLSEFPLPAPWKQSHSIELERQPAGWFVKVDDQLVTTRAHRSGGELPEFRLSVADGPAWFSDLFLEELQPVR